jgi:hypothetical protein
MDRTRFRLVLAPGLRYDDVAQALADWEGGSTDHLPALGGEPISARWTRGADEITYSANAAIGLRVLEGTGLDRTDLASMSTEEALRLSGSTVEEEALLGATALGLLVDPVRVGAEGIAAHRAAHPDRDPVFGLLGAAADRRQVLRGFLADPPPTRTRQLDVVRAALADDDWEVRWSAVIGAHDLGLSETALDVRRCPVGRAPDRDQREVLEVLRDVVGHRLAGGPSTTPGAAEIAAILDGDDIDPGPPSLLVTALRRTALDEVEADVPADFVQVPVEPHWLGGNGTPVRRVTPGAPYAIAAAPVPDVPAEQVQQRLAELTAEMGRPCRLPTADELEMAVRGPDGRRFPWGNARESGWRLARSPWGLTEPLLEAEWVAGETAAALPASRRGCGAAPERMATASLRPVLGD